MALQLATITAHPELLPASTKDGMRLSGMLHGHLLWAEPVVLPGRGVAACSGDQHTLTCSAEA